MPWPFRTVTQDRWLLAEGPEEEAFWRAFLARHGKAGYQVDNYNGKSGFSPKMGAVRNTPGFERVTWLGIVTDADTDPVAAFARMRDALNRAGLPSPARAWASSTNAPAPRQPVITAFVLPDGTGEGNLESLLWRPMSGQPLGPCVDVYFSEIGQRGIPVPREIWKARVHAYLAGLTRPDLRLGSATSTGLLDPVIQHQEFQRLLALLP